MERRDQSIIYTHEGLSRELRQAEILTNLDQYVFEAQTGEVMVINHPFVVVLSQDCDLLWDYDATEAGKAGELNEVLLYEVEVAENARKKLPGSDIWRRVKGNRDERYHLLEAVPAECDLCGEGMPTLVIDFKRYFTLPAKEIYRQIGAADRPAIRRCRLNAPYKEHLQTRVAFYMQRVGLARPHQAN